MALLLSGTSAYFTVFDRLDYVVTVWDGPPYVGFKEETLGFQDQFQLTLFNLGNRVVIVSKIEPSFFLVPNAKERLGCEHAMFGTPFTAMYSAYLSTNHKATILKPGEATSLVLDVTEVQLNDQRGRRGEKSWLFKLPEEFFSEPSFKQGFRAMFCFDFTILTPGGSRTVMATKGVSANFDPSENRISVESISGERTQPLVLHRARWPFN